LTDSNDQRQGTAGSDASKRRPSLSLFVPPQSPAAPDSFLLDPKKTAAWFESLPKANVGETARRIYSTLVDFNRMELPPVLRARNAEQFREPVDYICRNLRRHFVDSGFPLREKGQKAAALARALYQELAIAYKSIIQDLLTGQAERFDRKLLVISLHRALSYLNHALAHSSLVYGPWPASLWREVHSIYAYGWQNSIHKLQVREEQDRGSRQSTLEEVYVTALLFAAAVPHRLRQGQQLALLEELPEWVRHVHLGPSDEAQPGAGQFQVDLFSDSPPMREAPDAPAANRRMRSLDLKPLLKHLRELFDRTPWQGSAGSDTRGNKLSRQLLRTVIQSWGGTPERRFVRTRLNFELTVVAGLNSLHDHLLRLQQTEDRDGDTSERYASSFLHQQDIAPVDPWSEPYSHGLGLRPLTVEAEAISAGQLNEGPFGGMLPDSQPSEILSTPNSGAGYAVQTLNESAGGYCIQWPRDELPRVRIGELMGLQSNSDPHEFSLATIRWMRQQPNQPLQFGVEILAPLCQAGEVIPSGESRKLYPRTPQRCLVIEPPKGSDHGCVILPSALFAVGATLQLHQGETRRHVRLSQVVETTGAYARYQFDEERLKKPTSQNSDTQDDFGDLWSNL